MERKLATFIENCQSISALRDMDVDNPVKIPFTNPNVGMITVVVCSIKEPFRLVLPLNVIWLNFDPSSISYRRALARVSKATSSAYTHTWKELTKFNDLFAYQFYDDNDLALITNHTLGIAPASTTVLGVVKTATAPTDSNNPVVVLDNDPRLTDARVPTTHTHPVLPASRLRTSSTDVVISASSPPESGMVLVATSPTTAVWRFVTQNDIH